MTKIQRIAVAMVLLGGLLLRVHNYTVYPQRGATSDEYTYAFLGVSLWTKGVPISWSFFDYTKREDLMIDNMHFPIVKPYFDHPPLFGLFVGGWAIANGQRTFEQITLPIIRVVPIALSVASLFLVFLIARVMFGYGVAFWALLIYATSTIIAIQQRVVLSENFLTPIFLVALYVYIRKQKLVSVDIVLLGVLSGISMWIKESGISVYISLLFLMISDRVHKEKILNFVLIFVFFVLLYAWYGSYFGWDQFVRILAAQSSRDIGPQTLWHLLSVPIIINKTYFDDWYFVGLVSLLTLWAKPSEGKVVSISSFVYILFLLTSLTRQGMSGWYLLPLFPFMAIATGKILFESVQSGSWFLAIPLFFAGMTAVQYVYEPMFGLVPMQFRLLVGILSLPFIVFLFLHTKKSRMVWGRIYFYLYIAIHIALTYYYSHPA